jgi:predicted transcriptional regulator
MSNALVGEKERPTTVTILVDDQLRERLVRMARANERSLGAEVRVALREYLGRHTEQ